MTSKAIQGDLTNLRYHGIVESGSVPEERCTELKTTTLPSILIEYNPHDVINTDDTGLLSYVYLTKH